MSIVTDCRIDTTIVYADSDIMPNGITLHTTDTESCFRQKNKKVKKIPYFRTQI